MSPSAAQWHAFIKEVVEHEVVWTVRDEDGFPTSTNHEGKTAMPFWSLKSRAEKIIQNVPSYNGFQPELVPLDDFINRWLIGLEKDGLFVGVNWSGKKATGYDLKPSEVLERIQYELETKN